MLKSCVAGLAVVASKATLAADDWADYSRETYEAALASGEPFLLDFAATWWPVCRSQQRTVSALIDSNDEYKKVKLIKVDWDKHRRSPISSELGIRRQSTMVVFKDGAEVDRIIAQTGKKAIEGLFKAVT